MKICPRCHLRYDDRQNVCSVDGAELTVRSDPLLGITLAGRFTLDRVLGEGGHATVYAAHADGSEPVAVKVLHEHLTDDPILRERFRREAELAASLAHPRIVRVLGVGDTPDGRPWLAMELLRGSPLDQVIGGRPMPLAAALAIGVQMAEGLARAHDLGLVHRDVKPSNVFIQSSDGSTPEVKFVDFGLARRIHEAAGARKLTQRGEILGTPAYIAPEILRGGTTGPAIDLYGLGCVLHEMLVGHPPFTQTAMPALLLAQLEQPAPDVRSERADCPAALAELVLALLAKDPKDRPPDAHQVESALRALLGAQRQEPALDRTFRAIEVGAATPSFDRFTQAAALLAARVPQEDAQATRLHAALVEQLSVLGRIDGELRALREQVRAVDCQAFEARERLGHAVREVGRELSDARVGLRDAEAALHAASDADDAARATFESAERARSQSWPIRFIGPSEELAAAAEQCALTMRDWCVASARLDQARLAIASAHTRVRDLERQLEALRGRLAEVTTQSDGARREPAAALVAASARREAQERLCASALQALASHLGEQAS